MHNHPDRISLHNEVHARPRPPASAPQRISHFALLRDRALTDPPAPLVGLCIDHSLPVPLTGQSHYFADFASYRLKWERHGEFDDFTVYAQGADPQAPFASPALALLPEGWIDTLPGELIAAIHLTVLTGDPDRPGAERAEAAAAHFESGSVVGSMVAEGAALALTDLRLGPDGFSRILLLNDRMTRTQAGREVQRLIEIEVYRLMAMLAFPVARASAGELDSVESALSSLVERLDSSGQHDEPELLRGINHQAALLERLASRTSFRFDAARAYHALVRQRLAELREDRIDGVQTLTGFLERRFGPAMSYCQSVASRLGAAAQRVERAGALLRTRVDIEREHQNQAMLMAMNRRAQLQLRLQQTVEGLSVAAITYYAVGLLGYAFKGLKAMGVPLNTDLATGLTVLPVAIVISVGLHRVRHRIFSGATTASGDRLTPID